MKKQFWILSFLTVVLILLAAPVFAEDQEIIYGSQLMTEQEQTEFHQKMRNAQTAEDREQIRREHHEQMQERAKEQGLTLPDEPIQKGTGMGKGSGKGMGSGHGMGSGSGKGMGSDCVR